MLRIALRATAVTIAAIAASVLICGLVLSSLGGRLDGVALWLCILCPLLTAWPVSAVLFSQSARLKAAHRDLARAHAQLAATHRRLAHKARHDDLTGMLNRESFFAVLEGSRRKADRGALLIIDADHFKRINDSYGHLTGDEALLLIAAALKRSLRAGDVLGRIGGEEFCAFLPGADEHEARSIAERVRREVELVRFRPVDERTVPLTVSIGGTMCGQDVGTADLMRSADRRLYEAKHGGRNLAIVDTMPKAA
ncbi:MAG: GGDEF domain-containing protein [Mesorhizobium sp.]|nr:GGDEF domain-containing protein [Mesorhizobium sp.]MBN9243067.1 GGDEF domain-containing protein [Mesorhizobium sp.]